MNLIERLKHTITFGLIQVIDYWEADLCTIGLKKDDKLIYISTYSYDVQSLKYDYDLEIINKERQNEINVIKEVRSASEEELVKEIMSFLEI